MPSEHFFPPLHLTDWQPTRDALHVYAKVLGKIRAALTPRQRHWWHISLHVTDAGLSTTPIPLAASESSFELQLNLRQHVLKASIPALPVWTLPLAAPWSAQGFSQAALAGLATQGVEVSIDHSQFSDETPLHYDPAAAERYFEALAQVDVVFKRFRAELPGETSPVQLWPHHFDLALTWLTGRKVAGADEADEEWADEQMGFGFVTGDASIPDAYFYITAYPWPPGLEASPLKRPAHWNRKGWKGAVLPYTALAAASQPEAVLSDFLWHTQETASARMLSSAKAEQSGV